MKITVHAVRPRNPLVAAARRRKAGSHRRSNASNRQRQARAMAHDIQKMNARTH